MERVVDASEIVWPPSFLDLDEEQIASIHLMDDGTLNRYSNQARFERHDRAIVRLYGEIHRRHPDNLSSLVRKAISEKILGRYDDALASFERLLNLQAGIDQDSRETRRHIDELRALKEGVTVGSARKKFKKDVEAVMDPKKPNLSWPGSGRSLSAEHLANLASAGIVILTRYSREAFEYRDYNRVILLNDVILKIEPENTGAILSKAFAFKALGQPYKALELLKMLNAIQMRTGLNNSKTLIAIERLEAQVKYVQKPLKPMRAVEVEEAPAELETFVEEVRAEVEEVVKEPLPEPEPEFTPKFPEIYEFLGRLEASCTVWSEAKELLGEGWYKIPEEEVAQIKAELEKYKEGLRANLPSSKLRSTEAKRFWASMESASRFIAAGNVRLESIRNLMGEYSTVRELFS